MFRSLTILRELVQSLDKVTLLLKHSVKLRRCILCGDVAACREMACVLCSRPATSWVHYTTSCNTQSSVPEDGQNNCPKHVELTGIINKPLLLHLVGCLYYLYFIIYFFRLAKQSQFIHLQNFVYFITLLFGS